MKKIFFLVLMIAMLLTAFPAMADDDACVGSDMAHTIWDELSSVGGVVSDCDTGWHEDGIFFFGEPSGLATFTIPEDGGKEISLATLRIYPQRSEEITSKYFPMLSVLLNHIIDENEVTTLDKWMEEQEFACKNAYINKKDYEFDANPIGSISIRISYNVENNELYARVDTMSINTEPQITESGIWQIKAFVDEFNMPTEETYIVSELLQGTFSNSATTNSDLLVVVFCEEFKGFLQIKIRLAEYGNNIVKNPYSSPKYYSVVMMDNSGQKHYYTGLYGAVMPAKGQDIYFSPSLTKATVAALEEGGTIRFAISEEDNSITNYVFSIEDASGFDIVYDEWIKQYDTLQ